MNKRWMALLAAAAVLPTTTLPVQDMFSAGTRADAFRVDPLPASPGSGKRF